MFRLAAFALAVVMMAGAAAAPAAVRSETLSPHAFTEAFAAAAAAAMPSAKVTVKSDLWLETRDASGDTTTTNLRNAYQIYRADPTQLDSVIRRYVALLVDTVGLQGATPPVDRTRIVPVLKATAWVETVRRQRQAVPPSQLLTEPFNTELMIVYAEDRPAATRFLMMRDDVGDRGSLRNLALANLNRLLTHIQMRQAADGIFLISAGGDYDASLLLADGIWSSGQIKVDGDIVAAVPAKDALLLTGSYNKIGIGRLRVLAAALATGPYALTSALFVYRGGGKWVKFEGE